MNDKEVLTEAVKRRGCQSSLLSTFEQIAQAFLSLVNGERGNGKVFIYLQDYLDGSILINGALPSRTVSLRTFAACWLPRVCRVPEAMLTRLIPLTQVRLDVVS
jgi:hypothetical protein